MLFGRRYGESLETSRRRVRARLVYRSFAALWANIYELYAARRCDDRRKKARLVARTEPQRRFIPERFWYLDKVVVVGRDGA